MSGLQRDYARYKASLTPATLRIFTPVSVTVADELNRVLECASDAPASCDMSADNLEGGGRCFRDGN